MTLSAPIRNGVSQSGGGGGGGGSYVPPEWVVAYQRLFSELSEINLKSGGSGNQTIDGKVWIIGGTSAATTFGVGSTSAGMKAVIPAGTLVTYEGATRNAPHARLPLSTLFAGVEDLDRKILRVAARFTAGGTPNAGFEYIECGFQSKVWDINRDAWHYQGYSSGVGARIAGNYGGTKEAGEDTLTTSGLGYVPTCYRVTLFPDKRVKFEISTTAAASLAAAEWRTLSWRVLAAPLATVSADEQAEFFVACTKQITAGSLTGFTLHEMKAETLEALNYTVLS